MKKLTLAFTALALLSAPVMAETCGVVTGKITPTTVTAPSNGACEDGGGSGIAGLEAVPNNIEHTRCETKRS